MLKGRISAALICLALPTSVVAEPDQTAWTKFYPMFQSGKLTGCQIEFLTIRKDQEYSGGEPRIVSGLLALMAGETPGVAFRLGISKPNAMDEYYPPNRVFLTTNFKTNAVDFRSSFPASSAGQRMFAFDLGDETTDAFSNALATNKLTFIYGMEGTVVDAPVTINLDVTSGVVPKWRECITALADGFE